MYSVYINVFFFFTCKCQTNRKYRQDTRGNKIIKLAHTILYLYLLYFSPTAINLCKG